MLLLKNQKLTIKSIITDAVFTVSGSTTIAVVFFLLTAPTYSMKGFGLYFTIAQCIGFSIGTINTVFFAILKPKTPAKQIFLLTICVITGAALGSFLGLGVTGHRYISLSTMISVAIILGFIISFIYIILQNYTLAKLLAKDEKLKRFSLEKEKLKSDLKLLQAQVEPHFLFNTLSNILSLLDRDTAKGKQMLENLTQYLRTSLLQSRKKQNSLKDEISMIQTYLDIYKIRMKERLSYHIEIPDDLLNIQIPPMILQPLVENAIKHGLEPKIEGGKILISAFADKNKLFIEVADTGMGIQAKSAPGVGTGNIKQRLATLYNNNASLNFEDINPSGLKAIVEIPHGRN